MLWCLVWHEVCLMCFSICFTYVGLLSYSNCLLCNRNWSDSQIDLMFPKISFFWGIAVCFKYMIKKYIPRIFLIWRTHLNFSQDHFPEMPYFDNDFSVSENLSLWNEMTVFKFQLRFEDVIGVNTTFRYQNKTQIFKKKMFLNHLKNILKCIRNSFVNRKLFWSLFLANRRV